MDSLVLFEYYNFKLPDLFLRMAKMLKLKLEKGQTLSFPGAVSGFS